MTSIHIAYNGQEIVVSNLDCVLARFKLKWFLSINSDLIANFLLWELEDMFVKLGHKVEVEEIG